jgi:hypothetical protein
MWINKNQFTPSVLTIGVQSVLNGLEPTFGIEILNGLKPENW